MFSELGTVRALFGHCSGTVRALSGHCPGIARGFFGHCSGIARTLPVPTTVDHFGFYLISISFCINNVCFGKDLLLVRLAGADVGLPELVKADTWPNRLIVGHKTVDGQNLAQVSPGPDPT